MFIGTAKPFAPGARLTIKFVGLDDGFEVAGVVVHASRALAQFQRIMNSGMGIRLIQLHERYSEVLGD